MVKGISEPILSFLGYPKNIFTKKPAKRKTLTAQLNEMLEKATHEELKQFVREKAAANPNLRNMFLSAFAKYNSDESKELNNV